MDVKTNKEYTAMLHEIEGVEREIRGREDQILAEMERAETLAAEVKREEAVFKAAEERHPGERARLDERAQRAARPSATAWRRSATRWRPTASRGRCSSCSSAWPGCAAWRWRRPGTACARSAT